MSKHFSDYLLNTFYGTDYFQAQLPKDYPLSEVLRKSRRFHRLPPNLRELSRLSRRYKELHLPFPLPFGLDLTDGYYDHAGWETDPNTRRRLTDDEVNAQWKPDLTLANFVVRDIPKPSEGFPDPDGWEPDEPPEPTPDDEDGPNVKRLLEMIADRGIEYVSRESGMSTDELRNLTSEGQTVNGYFWLKNPTENENAQGCNQYTGPGCGIPPRIKYAGTSTSDIKQREKYVKALLGDGHEAKVKAISGALDGATITLDTSHKSYVNVKVDHPEYWSTHVIERNKKTGELSHYLENIFVKEPADDKLSGTPPRKGIGTEVFGKQVDGAVKSGVAFIRCHAAKENPEDESKPHNGYYTWPRFGFDQRLDDPHGKAFPEIQEAREKFPQAKSVLDLFETKEGRDHWREHGTDLTNCRFDTTAGSRSLEAWENYKAEQRAKQVKK